mmetsp:Transcript_124188/g.362442  ORF Transcript_124188/g.362442 Transcript_124188/m.362442 type:complete len:244 (+) Transcript_124188:280-1011(+)
MLREERLQIPGVLPAAPEPSPRRSLSSQMRAAACQRRRREKQSSSSQQSAPVQIVQVGQARPRADTSRSQRARAEQVRGATAAPSGAHPPLQHDSRIRTTWLHPVAARQRKTARAISWSETGGRWRSCKVPPTSRTQRILWHRAAAHRTALAPESSGRPGLAGTLTPSSTSPARKPACRAQSCSQCHSPVQRRACFQELLGQGFLLQCRHQRGHPACRRPEGEAQRPGRTQLLCLCSHTGHCW